MKVSEFDLERIAPYGQFRGDRWGRIITYGKNKIENSIVLNGVLLCYVKIGFNDEEEFINSTMRILLADPSKDNEVGRWTFWFNETEVNCQIDLIAPAKLFDTICHSLEINTKRPDALYNVFVKTDLEKLSKSENCITEYTVGFIEKLGSEISQHACDSPKTRQLKAIPVMPRTEGER